MKRGQARKIFVDISEKRTYHVMKNLNSASGSGCLRRYIDDNLKEVDMTGFEGDMKKEFILGEVFSLTLGAATQRAKFYKSNAPENEKEKFRKALRKRLEELAKTYVSKVSENDHVQNIQNLSDEMSNQFNKIFKNGGFRIGLAQKALNLYLKYRWCMGDIEMPPQCPVDSIILSEARIPRDIKWTQIKSISDYKQIIKAIREKAKPKPLAEWELEVWNKKRGN